MRKNTFIILGVLAALAVAVVVMKRKPVERGITRLELPKVDAKDIDHITVTGTQPIELVKKDTTWQLADGRNADQSAVTRATEALAKMKSSDLIGHGSDQFAASEVDDAKGAHVTIGKGGVTVMDFIVGKSLGGQGTAVRVGEQVFAVKDVSPGLFVKPVSTWIERKVFAKSAGDMTRLEVKLDGAASYTLVKKDTTWDLEGEVPAGFKLDATVATSLASAVANLRAKDVLVAADATPPEHEDVFVIGWKEGTSTLRVARTAAEADSLHARVDGVERTYVVSDGTMASLRKTMGDLRDASLMTIDTAKATGLTIIDGAAKHVFAKKAGVWTLVSSTDKKPDDFAFDPQAVDRRISQLSTAKGTRIVDDAKADTGLAAAKTKIAVKLDGAPEATLAFGNTIKDNDKDMVYARGNTGHVVLAAPYVKTNLVGGLSTFAKRAAPPGGDADALSRIDPAQLQGLPPEVRAGLMKQIEQKRREQELMKRVQQQPR